MYVRLIPAALILLAVSAASETWIVARDGTGDATTIQGGIDLASEGDVVLVRAGQYPETFVATPPWGNRSVHFELKNGVAVISESGPEVTIVGGGSTDSYGAFVPVSTSTETRVEGFTFKGMSVGCYVWQSFPVIEGNIFLDHEFEAVQMNFAAPTVRSNTIIGVGAFAIRGQPGSIPTVLNNIVVGAGTGVGIICDDPSSVVLCNDVVGHEVNYAGCGDDPSNFSLDPGFCDPSAHDYGLMDRSPCAPENSPPGCGLIGALGVRCGATPIRETSWARLKGFHHRR